MFVLIEREMRKILFVVEESVRRRRKEWLWTATYMRQHVTDSLKLVGAGEYHHVPASSAVDDSTVQGNIGRITPV